MDQSHPSKKFVESILICGFIVCVALFSAVVIRYPDNFFADDSYFYFQIASNAAHHLGSTFNGIMPTNGYHPLWMLICIAVFKVVPSKMAAVHVIGAAISLFGAGTLYLLARVSSKTADGLWWVPFLLYIPFLFLSQLGTEGALSGFLIALLVFSTIQLGARPSLGRAVFFGLTGSLSVLARLDNIFIVCFIFLAVLLFSPIDRRSSIRRNVLKVVPIYFVFWGAYITSNLVWFGIFQPISGMLKARHAAHASVTIPPHVFFIPLIIIVPAIVILARFRRDSFFCMVEAPFTLGVFAHALYIVTVMRSGETRWTWYYTTWMLLASMLMARVVSLLFASRSGLPSSSILKPGLRNVLGFLVLVFLLLAWFPLSYRKFGHTIPDCLGEGYQANLSDRLHLKTVLTFDKPGRMAYYSDVRVVPLDGLMTDVKFQRSIASKGIAAFDSQNDVTAFIGPPQPFDANGKAEFCDNVYLGSTQFHCLQTAPDTWIADRVEVFSRLTGASAGSLYLDPMNLAWNHKDDVAVWLISPNPLDEPAFKTPGF